MVIWSNVPPLIEMSVWTPKPPRWRTSTPETNFKTSLTLVAAARWISSLVITATTLAACKAVSGAREPVTTTSSSFSSLCVRVSAANGVRVLTPSALACAKVATLSVPTITSFPKHEKSAYPLREKCVKRRLARLLNNDLYIKLFVIKNGAKVIKRRETEKLFCAQQAKEPLPRANQRETQNQCTKAMKTARRNAGNKK